MALKLEEMPNRNLSPTELDSANELLNLIRSRLKALSGDDSELLFAYRRKIAKELGYDERSKPMIRRKLKTLKRKDQNGRCALCPEPLPAKYAVLDRVRACDGYTAENTRLICETCDRKVQLERGYR